MGRASKLPEYSMASVSLPRLITGEVEEGLAVDEVQMKNELSDS